MTKSKIAMCFILVLIVALLSACSGAATSQTAHTVIEMELTQDYDASDPFINEKLFYVDEDMDTLHLDVTFALKGESGILEIADNESKQVIWNDTWDGDVEKTTFTVTLEGLVQEKEYVVRFTGTKITYAKIVITSENDLVKERERPQSQTATRS